MQIEKSVVVVTRGVGFLAQHVAGERRFTRAQVLDAGSRDNDLRDRREVRSVLRHACPVAVMYLTASGGGIGANRAEPGRFLYENTITGVERLQALLGIQRPQGAPKWNGLRLPQVHATAVPQRRPLERLRRGDQRALRSGEGGAAERGTTARRTRHLRSPAIYSTKNRRVGVRRS